MTIGRFYPENIPASKPLVIGERVLHDVRRRIHELENHFRLTPKDRRELEKLKAFLRLQATGGDNGQE